ncbi:MAG TPA: F0F1 ATP synthase subunit B [Candidatus Dormibacteraeota bacterium]|nr:F0F1 ATP synthase subunit B [Candidatus Dormibacteraeota bacterium]
MYLASADASIITVNGTFLLELVAFIVMVAILWKYAYPSIARIAEGRQKLIADQLAEAEKRSQEAEQRLKEAEAKLNDARAQAQEVIAGAARSGDQLREELKAKGEEEARRQVEKAVREIDAARQQALESVRSEVSGIVLEVTQKVIGDALDGRAHQKLIDQAIKEIGVGGKR